MIQKYLEELKAELAKAGADPALIQDALYDAEEYLRSEISQAEGEDDEGKTRRVIDGYGTPAEIAASYLDAELTVTQAMRLPESRRTKSLPGRFFGILADPRAYGALFYMLLSMATGIAYFTIAVTGVSISLGMSILIFGVPIVLLFLSLIRGVSFIEGRWVEAMLGVRMPRRPRIVSREGGIVARIKWWITDRRTWTTLAYMLLQLPLGIVYFTGVVTVLAVGFAIIAMPTIQVGFNTPIAYSANYRYWLEPWAMPLAIVFGIVWFVTTMHAVSWIGRIHGLYAKAMLVGKVEERG